MFQMGDLVTPKPAYINDGKIFEIVGIDYIKNTYELRPWEALPDEGICERWEEDSLCLIRTIESIETEVSKRLVRTISEIIEETVKNFHSNKIGWDRKERDLTRKVVSENTIWLNAKNIDKEVKDMSKILEIYKDKKEKEIEQKYDAQLNELEENDPLKVYLKQAEETIKEMLNVEDVTLCINSPCVELTQETIDAKNKIIEVIRNEKRKINNKIKEIEALLELAPGYEEKIKILRDYEIIDKKKNILL